MLLLFSFKLGYLRYRLHIISNKILLFLGYTDSFFPWFRDLPANSRTTHSQRGGWNLLPSLLFECGQFQRGPGGAPSDEEGLWERGCGPTGPGCTQTQLSASSSWVTSSVPSERRSCQKCGGHLSCFDWIHQHNKETININVTDCCWL